MKLIEIEIDNDDLSMVEHFCQWKRNNHGNNKDV